MAGRGRLNFRARQAAPLNLTSLWVIGPFAGKTPMLRPDGADLFVRRKLALRGFGQRSIEIGSFLRRELIGRLVHACELQQNSREIVRRIIGKTVFLAPI